MISHSIKGLRMTLKIKKLPKHRGLHKTSTSDKKSSKEIKQNYRHLFLRNFLPLAPRFYLQTKVWILGSASTNF